MTNKYYEQTKRTDNWLASATRFVHFGPDKKAVRGELFNHIMDRQETYLARGYSQVDARRCALDDMGDPNAIAAELGRLHRPFWGYTLRVSQVILVLLLIIVLFPLSDYNLHAMTGIETNWFLGERLEHLSKPPKPKDVTTERRQLEILEEFDLRGSANLPDHRLTVPAAWLERETVYDVHKNSFEKQYLVFYIRAATWKFWAPSLPRDRMVSSNILTDSDGITYSDPACSKEGDRDFTCAAYLGSAGETWYEVRLTLSASPTPAEVQVPDHLTVPVGYGIQRLYINFEEGVVS